MHSIPHNAPTTPQAVVLLLLFFLAVCAGNIFSHGSLINSIFD